MRYAARSTWVFFVSVLVLITFLLRAQMCLLLMYPQDNTGIAGTGSKTRLEQDRNGAGTGLEQSRSKGWRQEQSKHNCVV